MRRTPALRKGYLLASSNKNPLQLLLPGCWLGGGDCRRSALNTRRQTIISFDSAHVLFSAELLEININIPPPLPQTFEYEI